MSTRRSLTVILAVLFAWTALDRSASAQGVLLTASGPINRSMGGAATAAPVDAIGAIRWNPATLGGLPCSELEFGADLIFPVIEAESSIAGLGGGSTFAEPGVTPVPSIGWVHHLDDLPITIGLGVMGVAGFRTNYPASLTNPVLSPQSNAPGVPGGLGRVYTHAQFLDVAPVVAVGLTEGLTIGFSPIVTMGEVFVEPLVVAAPDDADGSGIRRYSTGSGTSMQWGAAAQLGAYYLVDEAWRVGAAVRTPTWMQHNNYFTQDELGNPKSARFRWDLPLVVSTGVSYAGLASTLIALDLRYVDYGNASGWGDGGFNADGSIRGLGWRGVFAVAVGAQHELTDRLTVRLGYTFNENPTPEAMTMINIAAPLHYQHEISAGGSFWLAENVSLNFAYTFYLPHEITGPLVTPAGPIDGSSVTSRESVHIASLGVTVRY